jgi:hypothetical protein
MANLLPDKLEKAVVDVLFRDAHEVGWETLDARARSREYRRWLSEPVVGGVLTKFMNVDEARGWIKDGPMKEYPRALSGIGKHARSVVEFRAGPQELVQKALGSSWQIEIDSQKIKPLRARATNGEETVVFAWGPQRDFKHLVWAALQAGTGADPTPWILCTVSSFVDSVPKNIVQRDRAIAKRCGLDVRHLTI